MNLDGREVGEGTLPGDADALGCLKVGCYRKSKSAPLRSLVCFSFDLYLHMRLVYFLVLHRVMV